MGGRRGERKTNIREPFGRNVDMDYPGGKVLQMDSGGLGRIFYCSDFSQGWHVFYDRDGKYLRLPGQDVAQIMLYNRP
jgi:hypothetical protein